MTALHIETQGNRMKPLPPGRGKVGMGVVRLNYSITYLDRTTPSVTLHLQRGGNFIHLRVPTFMLLHSSETPLPQFAARIWLN